MGEKIKRSQILTFMDVDPPYEEWALIGEGVTDAQIDFNPEISSEVYIHQDSASAEIERYAPSMGVESAAVKGDSVFDFVDELSIDRAVLNEAHTSIVNVWIYKPVSGQTNVYEAEKQEVTISIENKGGAGGESSKINYTIHYRGDPIKGEMTISTGQIEFSTAGATP